MSRTTGKGDPITEVVNQLSRLPGIGERTATRLAYFLVESPVELPQSLAAALLALQDRVMRCGECGNMTDVDPCRICGSQSRDTGILCVVEQSSDIAAIERTQEFRGKYHVLHGLIRPLEGIGPDRLNLASLVRRSGSGEVSEVIVATNPSVEGEATAIYIRNLLVPLGVSVSRIASGLPVGGELEYADRATLGRALMARQPLR
jgi:recombination protein RecR